MVHVTNLTPPGSECAPRPSARVTLEPHFRTYVSQDISADAVVDALEGTVKLTYGTLAFKCFDAKCQEPPCAPEVGVWARPPLPS
jgi:hypothetical protein